MGGIMDTRITNRYYLQIFNLIYYGFSNKMKVQTCIKCSFMLTTTLILLVYCFEWLLF